MSEQMTVKDVPQDVQETAASLLADLQNQSVAAAQRDPNIPAGTPLGSSDVSGFQVNWNKQNSMVRSGSTPLPERFAVYDRTNRVRWLPTARMTAELSKRAADGKPAFRPISQGVWPGVPERTAIDGLTCDICNESRLSEGVLEQKRFFKHSDYEAHMTAFHPLEYTSQLREEERSLQRQALEAQKAQSEAMIALAQSLKPAEPEKPVKGKQTEA